MATGPIHQWARIGAARGETSTATILLTEAPEPKVRDRQTGEIAKDINYGEALMTIGVVYIEDGEPSLIKVTVLEGGISEGLTLRASVCGSGPCIHGPTR